MAKYDLNIFLGITVEQGIIHLTRERGPLTIKRKQDEFYLLADPTHVLEGNLVYTEMSGVRSSLGPY